MRNWKWHGIVVYALIFLFVGYMIVVPVAGLILQRINPPESMSIEYAENMSLAEQVRLRSMEACTALVFFALGAAIGSFLNVVAYRAPRGESITFRRSACPSCGEPIKGRDNVPILGWLLLKGRCRTCAAPISPRYLTAELVMAILFLLLYLAELISGGANLPFRRPNYYNGVVWIIFYTKWDLVRLYFFHGFALSVLFTWALIDIDRKRIPAWLRCLACVALALPPMVWPDLLPVAWWRLSVFAEELPKMLRSWAVVTSLLGGFVGVLLGAAISRAINRRHATPTPGQWGGHVASTSAIIGLTLGWQAIAGVWVIALALRPVVLGVARRLGLDGPPTTLLLMVASVIQLLAWRWTCVTWWPSGNTSPVAWAVYGVVLLTLCALNRAFPVRNVTAAPSPESAEPRRALIDGEITPVGGLPGATEDGS